jgi:LysR family transcriptional regulator, glycine cleavage system transcriptional activator
MTRESVAFARRRSSRIWRSRTPRRAGLGVAVAPRPTVEADLASGALVAPFGFVERPAPS